MLRYWMGGLARRCFTDSAEASITSDAGTTEKGYSTVKIFVMRGTNRLSRHDAWSDIAQQKMMAAEKAAII
jgi:hypothetical protein